MAACREAASIPLPTLTETSIEVWPLLNVFVIVSPLSISPVTDTISICAVATSSADEISYALDEINAAPRLVCASAD